MLGGGRIDQPDRQLDQPPERRGSESLAQGKLGVIERGPIARCGGLDRRVVRLVGLDDGPTGQDAASGSTDRLDQELVRALRGPLVRQIERHIRRDDADQGHRRDVETLRNQARADEDVEAALGEGVHHPLRGATMLDDVAVQAPDPQPREGLADFALDALRAAAQVADARRSARWTARRERGRPTTVVAAQCGARLVVDERPLAVGTSLDMAAVATQDDRRGPPPVEDEDRLLAASCVQGGQCAHQRP